MMIIADDLPRFMQCNGSRLMAESFPSDPSAPDSIKEEGTAAHYVAAAVFTGQFSSPYELVDRKTPNGVYVTLEIAQFVEQYLAGIETDFAWHGVEVETSHGSVGGRADHAGYTLDGVARIKDLKGGYSIVEPEMNWTLISHAIALTADMDANGIGWHTVELSIFQPRAYHPAGHWRTWTVTREQLYQLRGRLYATFAAPLDTLQTGPECLRCHALADCPAARKADYNAIDATDRPFADAMPSDALAQFLELLEYAEKRIKSKRKAVEDLVSHRLKTGNGVGNYHLEPTFGHRKWNGGLTPAMLNALLGVDVSEPKAASPAEAERRGASPEVIKLLTSKPSTGTKLIKEDLTKRINRKLGV